MKGMTRAIFASAMMAAFLSACGEKPAEEAKKPATTQEWAENMRKSAEKDVDNLQKKPANKSDWYK